MEETIAAVRELNEHPTTVFTVLTGEGRFFSAGADVRGKLPMNCYRKNAELEQEVDWILVATMPI